MTTSRPRTCWLALALLGFASTGMTQSTLPTTAQLSYSESRDVAPPAQDCRGGGLVGGVNCVTTHVEGAGEGRSGEETGSVRSTLSLTPDLIEVGDELHLLLQVEGGIAEFSGHLDDTARAEAQVDADDVWQRLMAFDLQLSPEQASRLRAGELLPVPIEAPFAGLRRLQLQRPVVVRASLPRQDDLDARIRFVFDDPDGSGHLPYLQPIFIEVEYSQPQEDSSRRVELLWDNQRVEVKVVALSPTLYRSSTPLVLVEGSGLSGSVTP